MMANVQFSVRLPANLVRRLDALVPKLRKVPGLTYFGAISMKRSTVARMAMARGVRLLEKECAKAQKNEPSP